MSQPPADPEVSVVVPVFNEAENVETLAREIADAMTSTGRGFEILFVDDGSQDDTAARCERQGLVRLLRHPRNLGQSAAVLTGMWAARGDVLVTLDGDGQNDPAAIPDLLAALNNCDVAQGVRTRRNDTLWRRFGSRFARWIRGAFLRDGIVDTGCALRAFPRREGLFLPAFNGLHRLMPVLFVFRGLKVAQIPVHHRPRTAGISKYGNTRRALRGLLDLWGLFWLKRRQWKGFCPVPEDHLPACGTAPPKPPGP